MIISKKDIDTLITEMERKFITKEEFDRRLEGKLNLRFDIFEERMDRKLDAKFGEVLQSHLAVMAILEEIQTESRSGKAAYDRHDRKLDDHEGRITKLEEKASV